MLPLFIAIYIVFGAFIYQGIHALLFNGTSVIWSSHRGKEIKLAPYAILLEMYHDSWRDNYKYLFGYAPSSETIKRFSLYKVIDEKTSSSVMNSPDQICVLENIENNDEQFSELCEDLDSIAGSTQLYSKSQTLSHFLSTFLIKD